ncbi:hypothetical protein MATL_G00007230 [Megalops atlanticus]|uniref:Uncharacterized protein n=1 Tax=Megalops atlanticus TaxID=7932 RepID=A0A9D3QGI5_MEGAT|nr:hypothetical protein MATL_G00007230 [Megalops atlanticus]
MLPAATGPGRRSVRFHKVHSHHLSLSQLPHALVHNPEDALQAAVQGQQVGLRQNGPQHIVAQRLPHHVAQPVLLLRQQLEAQQG